MTQTTGLRSGDQDIRRNSISKASPMQEPICQCRSLFYLQKLELYNKLSLTRSKKVFNANIMSIEQVVSISIAGRWPDQVGRNDRPRMVMMTPSPRTHHARYFSLPEATDGHGRSRLSIRTAFAVWRRAPSSMGNNAIRAIVQHR